MLSWSVDRKSIAESCLLSRPITVVLSRVEFEVRPRLVTCFPPSFPPVFLLVVKVKTSHGIATGQRKKEGKKLQHLLSFLAV